MSRSNPSMSSPQEREATLFALALAKPAGERAAFLEGACLGDAALRQRLEALLAAHEKPDSLFAAETVRVETPVTEAVGTTVGRYKLLEPLGEGGFGSVWLAEQKEPVRRRVALKVIKLGMDTKQVVARFEAERQALALMDHPNIAKVLDAGTFGAESIESEISNLKSRIPQGRPYFVMELVRGIPITKFCDENKLATQERLDLFIKVCHAVQHAHQKGIIHRDLKPSNVLVTLHDGVPVPKVIDFGIAKATQQELTDKTIHTMFQQFIGTPAYVSPEQAEMSGLDIDTRSDIYSLGVLLYELLTGVTPFDGRALLQSGLDEMRRIIREEEPKRPSTRLSTFGMVEATTLAKDRREKLPALIHLVCGDLDWIVMKCLEKDRTRRYETANGLAADIQRHLNNEPVLARPPSAAYKLQKAWRRNKVLYTAGAAISVTLLIGIMVSAWQANVADDARSLAEKNLQKAMQAERELKDALASAKSERDRAIEAESRLDRQVKELLNSLVGLVDADLNLFVHFGSTVDRMTGVAISALGRTRAAGMIDDLIAKFPHADVEPLYARSIVRLYAGDLPGFQSDCRLMLHRFEATTNFYFANRITKSCLLVPQSFSEEESRILQRLKTVEQSEATKQPPHYQRWADLNTALWSYRNGALDESVQYAIDCLAKEKDPKKETFARNATANTILAMCQARKGQWPQARSSLETARTEINTALRREGRSYETMLSDNLRAIVLFHEAWQMIQGKDRPMPEFEIDQQYSPGKKDANESRQPTDR